MTDTHTATGHPHARHTAAGGGEAYWFFDSLMVIQADQPGQPVIIEATVAPGGGAPLHVHDDLDDSFYLVSGRLAIRCGEQAFAVSPGAYVALPHGVPHTFRVVATCPPSCSRCTRTTRSCASSGPPGGLRPAVPCLPPGRRPIWTARSSIAARTGQPVIGPPMSEEEAARIAD